MQFIVNSENSRPHALVNSLLQVSLTTPSKMVAPSENIKNGVNVYTSDT